MIHILSYALTTRLHFLTNIVLVSFTCCRTSLFCPPN